MVAIQQDSQDVRFLPPPLVHGLRERSSHRLVRMASAPGKRGFGRTLFKRIVPLVNRERTMIEKAVSMAYLCSYFADHIVLAEVEATLVVEHRDLTGDEETDAWEDHYHNVLTRLAPEVPDAEELLATIQRLEGYTRLPLSLHAARGRHWKLLERLLSPTLRHRYGRHDADAFLRNKIFEVAGSRRSVKAKARLICLSASLLADIGAWKQGADWHDCYAAVMIDLYTILVDHPKVLTQLINMDERIGRSAAEPI